MAVMTALHQAVLDDNLVVVRLLLLHGARIDQVAQSHTINTNSQWSTQRLSCWVLNKLIQIDQADADSWTPLHAASANGHSGIVRSREIYSKF